MAKWRDAVGEAQRKYLVLLHPQYMELIFKMTISMRKAEFGAMVSNFQKAVFALWFHTGSAKKMEDFVLEVWNGRIFLLDDRSFRPTNNQKIARSELLKFHFVYNPRCQRIDLDLESAFDEATRFTTFLGDPPSARPWVAEWDSERKEVLRRAEEEIGVDAVNEILLGSGASNY